MGRGEIQDGEGQEWVEVEGTDARLHSGLLEHHRRKITLG